MEPIDKLRLSTLVVLTGFIIAVFFHGLASFFHLSYPLNSFLFDPSDRFMDFFNVYELTLNAGPYFKDNSFLACYFPGCYLFFLPFTWLNPIAAFTSFSALFCFSFYLIMKFFLKSISNQATSFYAQSILIFFLSYPVLFCLDRGNVENLLFLLVGLFIICYLQKKYFLATVWLSCATATKLYPLVLIVLFLKAKRYKEIAYCVALIFLITLFALIIFQGSIGSNVSRYFKNMAQYKEIYLINDYGLYFSSSLFSLIKMLLRYFYLTDTHSVLPTYRILINELLPYYTLATFAIFAGIVGYIYFYEERAWKQILLLINALILLPVISGDYKLIYLFLPFLIFITSNHSEKNAKLYTLLFAILFVPKNYCILPYSGGYSLNNLLNILVLLFFSASIIVEGLTTARAIDLNQKLKLYEGQFSS